ncbi:hypothetical protein SAMD00019534_011950 [Acytostelium subglobosum LB1]|uniref:hypothetical protein n=1 Tax=Acytostelium subglobosum LB1 TaxID=1410327 RepID=UPI0006451263|nr:hypothetical protein SAMD00019534_011950 [Acytostelium subglobosum LB1]GAM18020.1 hypothetical protein SAMD00019534_011950 [Acytostelium subglobosum LB1]|eukprot:XP_012758616.1 hypothetical protein SAMD00019534_011950 [Acytostelium subglobosum LB1]
MIKFGAARIKTGGTGVDDNQQAADLHDETNWRSSAGPSKADDLWRLFRASLDSPKSPQQQQTSEQHLKRVVSHFHPQYDIWNIEMNANSFEMKTMALKIKSTPILDIQSLQFVSSQLCTFVMSLSVALTDDSTPMPTDGIYLMALINILSRSQLNNALLLQENALTHPFQAARLATLKLSSIKDTVAGGTFRKWWPYLRLLLGHFCNFVSNFSHDRAGWLRSIRHSFDLTTLASSNDDVLGAPSSPNIYSLLQLYKLGVVGILLDCIQFYNENLGAVCASDSGSANFRYLLVDALGCLVFSSNKQHCKLKESGAEMKILLGGICGGQRGGNRHSTELQSFNTEFQFQLHMLRAIRELIDNNVENARWFINLKGFKVIKQFILWTVECFQAESHGCTDEMVQKQANNTAAATAATSQQQSNNNNNNNKSDAVRTPTPLKRNRIPQLVQLFDVLHKLTFSSIPLVIPTSPHGANKEISTSTSLQQSSLPSSLSSTTPSSGDTIVLVGASTSPMLLSNSLGSGLGGSSPSLLSSLGNNTLEDINSMTNKKHVNTQLIKILLVSLFKAKTRSDNLELQLSILEYLCSIVNEHSDTLEVLRKHLIYKLLLTSNHFYPCSNDNNNDNNNNTSVQAQRRQYLSDGLRTDTMNTVQFLATLDQRDNCEEIGAILDLLKAHASQPAIIVDACQMLINITKRNPKTIKALLSQGIFEQLANFVQQLLDKAVDSETESQQQLAMRARNMVLSYLGQLIVNEEMSHQALVDRTLITTLFNILQHPELKQYALTLILFLMKLSPEGEHDLNEIYTTFANQLSNFKDDGSIVPNTKNKLSPEYSMEVKLSLLDIIRQVIKGNPKKQYQFKKFHMFAKVANLVNVGATASDTPNSMANLTTLSHSVLRTIVMMMAKSAKIKRHFIKRIGYDSLKNIILKSEPVISSITLNILLDMVVDNEFDREENYFIHNIDALLLIIHLLHHFPLDLQRHALDTITHIVQKCTTNQLICCNCHLIYHLLCAIDAISGSAQQPPMDITSKILHLVQTLGLHSVNVRELKKLFRLLKSDGTGGRRLSTTSVLLSTLQNIAVSRNPGPQVYFDFDGKSSFISLPTFEKWPFTKGFTFCTWLRVESFVDPTGAPEYKPRLISLLSDTGSGVEALFIYQQLQIQMVTPGTPPKPVLTNPPSLEEGKWYFISIVYMTNLFSSEIRVYIDGQLRSKATIKLTANLLSGSISNCRIGNNVRLDNNEAVARSNPLYGQLGALNIFDETLSPSQIQTMFSLGPNFSATLQDIEGLASSGGSGKSSHAHTVDQSLTSRLFLSYNCRAIEGDQCLDTTPNIGADRHFDGTLHSVHPCVSRDIKDIIYCLGGIKVLFPLLPQMNQQLLQQQPENATDTANKLIIQILGLFRDMLRGSEANQEEMLRCNGMPVLAYLLQMLPPEYITTGVLTIFVDMGNQISEPSLVEEVYRLLLDFRLWIKTKVEVQKSLLVMLKQILIDKIDQLEEIFTVQAMIDLIANFYWSEFHETSKVLNTKDKRPSPQEMSELRYLIFDIVHLLVRNPTPAEVATILRFAVYTLDVGQAVDTLAFIFDLIAKANKYQPFFDEMDRLGSTDIFLTLLSRKDESVRVAALQLIAKLHLIPMQPVSSGGAFGGGGGGLGSGISLMPMIGSASPNKTLKRKAKSIFQDSVIIARSLHMFPLTEFTYGHLLAFALGSDNGDIGFNLNVIKLENLMVESITDIVFPEVMSCILKLLPVAESVQLLLLILQNIKLLIGHSAANRNTFLQIDKWPDLLFAVLNDTEIKDNPQYGNVTELTLDIMKILAIHALNDVKGYKKLELILSSLRPYAERGVLDYHMLTRSLLNGIACSIRSEALRDKDSSLHDRSKRLSENLVHLLLLTEEFIFYSPLDDLNPLVSSFAIVDLMALETKSVADILAAPPPDAGPASIYSKTHEKNDRWTDYQLATDVLEMVEALKMLTLPKSSGNDSNNLQTGKPQLYQSHQQRVIHRLFLEVIRECYRRAEPVNVTHNCLFKYRTVMEKDLHSKSDDSNLRCAYALSKLIRAMQIATHNNSVAHQKMLVAPIKELVRKLHSLLTAHLLHKQVSGSATKVTQSQQSEYEGEIGRWVSEISDSTRSDDFWSTVTSNPRWTQLCDHIHDMAGQIVGEDKALSIKIESRRKKRAKNLQLIDDREAEIFSGAEKKADADLKNIDKTLLFPERDRRIALLNGLQLTVYETAAHWRRILRSLTNERGPWGTTESVVHWKMDKTENKSRMRRKLKRNYSFDEHANCTMDDVSMMAAARDNSSDGSGTESTALTNLKGLKPVPSNKDDIVDDWAVLCDYDNLLDDPIVSLSTTLSSVPNSPALNSSTAASTNKEKIVYSTQCDLVTPKSVYKGRLDITSMRITFTQEFDEGAPGVVATSSPNPEPKIKSWNCEHIKDIQLRRYLLRGSALEVFMQDQTTFFLNFKKKDRNKVYSKVNSVRRAYAKDVPPTPNPADTLKKATSEWQQRRMSNFDYLMLLNTIAGRTYNDLTQYPVFPWVLNDYKSATIDLSNPEVYRDLSRPIGALNPKRLSIFQERYSSFDDPLIPKFHYGSHYSSAGIVLHYLVRMEPYTTLFLQLQGGNFDHPDRMFDSIELAYRNSLNSTTDVKELIPEFFYMPEFLTNHNNFSFGAKQDGRVIGDVLLPPWAATAQDFVRINREALESEYVSLHLHEWIDLIFGIKQRGRQAIDACNVFYYLTYEGSVDIDLIEDEFTRRATESQINNFGQTPTQLFAKKAHPAREQLQDGQLSLFRTPHNMQFFGINIANRPLVYISIPEPTHFMSYLSVTDRVTTINRSRVLTSHKWFPNTPNDRSPFTLELEPPSNNKRRIGLPFANDVVINQKCFAITNDGRYTISCGHWDNSFKLAHTDSAKPIQSVVKHKDIVTCVAWSDEGQTLITGSRDTTLMLWNLIAHRGSSSTSRFDNVPTHILYGHDDEITCVDLNVELDICLSGSKDGTCIIHNLGRGEYVRSICLPKQSSVNQCIISNQGHIVIYSQDDLMIYLYSINGQLLSSVETHGKLNSMIVSKDSEYLITGGDKGTVVIRTLYNLKFAYKLSFDSAIHSLAMSNDQRHLMVGLEDGRLLIIASVVGNNNNSTVVSSSISSILSTSLPSSTSTSTIAKTSQQTTQQQQQPPPPSPQ